MPRPRLRPLPMLAGIAAASLLAIGSSAGASPSAHASRSCTPPKYPGLGYFTSLQVSHVGCRGGKKVTLAYYRCRTKHGRRGHCHSRVLGYHCTEVRRSIPTQFNARVTCKRGAKRVVHTYQQNLD
jgi:hypothetical protein